MDNIFGDYKKESRLLNKDLIDRKSILYSHPTTQKLLKVIDELIIEKDEGSPIPFVTVKKDSQYRIGATYAEHVILAKLLSERDFPKGERFYALPELQFIYDRYENDKEWAKEYKKKNIYTRESFLYPNKIVTNPEIIVNEGLLDISGKSIETDLNGKKIDEVMIENNLLLKNKSVESEPVKYGYDGNEGCINAYWFTPDGGRFFVQSVDPTDYCDVVGFMVKLA